MILIRVLCLRCHTDQVMKGDKTKAQRSSVAERYHSSAQTVSV
jgi:hypothetical protein